MSDTTFEQLAVAHLLSDSNQVIIVIDAQMVVRWCSGSAANFGLDLVGRTLDQFIHPDDLAGASQAFDGAALQPHFEPSAMANAMLSFRIRTSAGLIPFDASGTWVADGSGQRWLIAVMYEVEARYRTSEAMRQLASGALEGEAMDAIIDAAHAYRGVVGAQVTWRRGRVLRTAGDLGQNIDAVLDQWGTLPHLKEPAKIVSVPAGDWCFGLPVEAAGDPNATLVLWGTGTAPDLAMLSAVVAPLIDLAAVSIALLRERTELERRASTDEVTGLLNRHAFFADLERVDGNCAIMYVDLDGFKAVNDELGHLLGDSLLKIVARRLLDAVREGDIVGRLGGDEFAVYCSAVTADDAHRTGERVVQALNGAIHVDEHLVQSGASVGVAHTDLGMSGLALVDAADRALLEAKSLGKGRVVVINANGEQQGLG